VDEGWVKVVTKSKEGEGFEGFFLFFFLRSESLQDAILQYGKYRDLRAKLFSSGADALCADFEMDA
jgi:hypothetical protein